MDEKEYLLNLIAPLVDFPEGITMKSSQDERGTFIDIRLDPKDIGRIIGKNGSTVLAIRTLVHTFGFKNNKNISLKINGNQNTQK